MNKLLCSLSLTLIASTVCNINTAESQTGLYDRFGRPQVNFKEIYKSTRTHAVGKPIKAVKKASATPNGYLKFNVKVVECLPAKKKDTTSHIACADMHPKTVFKDVFTMEAGNTKTISQTTITPYVQTLPNIVFESGKYSIIPQTTKKDITTTNQITISISKVIQNSLAYSLKLNFEDLAQNEDTIFWENEVYINPSPTINKRVLVADGILKLNKEEIFGGKMWLNLGESNHQKFPENKRLWVEIIATK